MGVVYKATDTKLQRPVALKFLAAHLVGADEKKARFVREAQAAAALDHPNICTVYEINEEDDKLFIAMAYLEGRTLAEKIEDGPLEFKEILDFGIQVGKGLEEAHAKKIYHRDIKPANLMITDKGASERLVKIMDFGLAQLAERSRLTRQDSTLGTPAYMSPEQTMGAGTDHRTDIWALGVVLYEMVSGRLPFQGDYRQAVMYSITSEEPEPLTGLRTGVPMELEWMIGKCLAKGPDDRCQNAGDLIVDLRNLSEKIKSGKSTIARTGAIVTGAPVATGTPAATGTGGGPSQAPAATTIARTAPSAETTLPTAPPQAAPLPTTYRLLQVTLALTAAALLALAFVHFRESAPPAPVRRFSMTPPVDLSIVGLVRELAAISPNGKHIAFVGAQPASNLWVWDLAQRQPRLMEGTEDALAPFWLPDSNFIGFGTNKEIKKVSVLGGLPLRLCAMPADFFGGGAWSPDGDAIVFSAGGALHEVAAAGGAPKLLFSPQDVSGSSPDLPSEGSGGYLLWSPHFLPAEAGPRVLVFTNGTLGSGSTMVIRDLESGRSEELGRGHVPFYAAGHIVYQAAPADFELWARPFSLDNLKPEGEAFPIAQDARGPSIASDGTLVYYDGGEGGLQQPRWFDRRGVPGEPIGRPLQDAVDPSLSPDGRRLAVSGRENGNQDVWVYDIELGVRTRLTTDPALDYRAVWSPDGEEIAFFSFRSDAADSFLRPADGGGELKALLTTPLTEMVSDWSRDGEYVLYSGGASEMDIRYLERTDQGGWEPRVFLATPFSERAAKLSPDGRFVAYSSDESGQYEVYVQPFPEGGRRVTVSSNGGATPLWSRDGRELFYVEDATLIAVSVKTTPTFSAGSASRLFEHPRLARSFYPQYDVSADGERFVIADQAGEAGLGARIQVAQNWLSGFEGR